MMSIAVLAVTDSSEKTAHRLKELYPGKADVYRPGKGELEGLVREIFHSYEGLVFIMASGIVIRMIAPLIRDKYNDPAVVTVDDARRFAVSTLSGHEGGANNLTWKVASLLGCVPVITTASDTNRDLILGIGCRRGAEASVIRGEIQRLFDEQGISSGMIRCAATVSIKRDEAGLIEALDEMDIPLVFLESEEIRHYSFPGMSASEAAKKHFDIPGVCEPCAMITARKGSVIAPKRGNNGVTLALVKENLCQED